MVVGVAGHLVPFVGHALHQVRDGVREGPQHEEGAVHIAGLERIQDGDGSGTVTLRVEGEGDAPERGVAVEYLREPQRAY